MDPTLITVLVAVGLWPLWSAALTPASRPWRALLPVVAVLVTGASFWYASSAPPADVAVPSDRPIEVHGPGEEYVSSDTCRKCHPEQHATWHASFHRTMTQPATPQRVIPVIDDLRFEHRGDLLRLDRRGQRFFAAIADGLDALGEPRWVEREVVQTTGSHHFQAFWFGSGYGRELTLFPLVYRIDEQRWIPVDAAFLMPPDTRQPLGGARWNTNCITCHTTGGQPRVDEPPAAETQVAEFGISCEACHGPGAEHVRSNRDPLRRYRMHWSGDADPTISNPTRMAPERSAEVCGQCHSVTIARVELTETWAREGFTYRPGDELRATRLVVTPEQRDAPELQSALRQQPDFFDTMFWADGQVRISGREYHGLVASPCYVDGAGAQKMTCLSCHDLHADDEDPRTLPEWARHQLKPGMSGDLGCTQCHAELADPIAAGEHSHHAPGTVGCYDCHMPYTSYGLLKAIRSHTVTSPSVDETVRTGRPNACNQCHLDRTLAWTSEQLEASYGMPSPALSEDDSTVAAGVVWALKGDAGQRVLAAWTMGWAPARLASGTDWMLPYLAELMRDPYHAVRFVAYRSARTLPGYGGGYDFLAPAEQRDTVLARLVDDWRLLRASRVGRNLLAVLIDPAGTLRDGEVRRLLTLRDLRRVFLGE